MFLTFIIPDTIAPMSFWPGIFSLIVGATGWYYLLYSKSAGNLAGIEGNAINLKRQKLRRGGGLFLFLLAIFMYTGCEIDPSTHKFIFLFSWLAVVLLLFVTVLLALIDVRLTNRLRRDKLNPPFKPPLE